MKTGYVLKFRNVFFTFTLLSLYLPAIATPVWNLVCPPDRNVVCTEDLSNLSRFGNAYYMQGNMMFSGGMPVVEYQLNTCQIGRILRTWTVTLAGNMPSTCTQTLEVRYPEPDIFQITWPQDYEVDGCNPAVKPHQLPAPNAYPTWYGDDCRMVGKSYKDMVFTVSPSCRKIMRTWQVIDWCAMNGNQGIWSHIQIIKIYNSAKPKVHCIDTIRAEAFNCKNAIVQAAPLQVDSTACDGNFNITNNSPFATNKGSDLSGVYPIGKTKVTFTVTYSCGFKLYCHTEVIVKDSQKPSPVCFGSVTTALMPVDSDNDGDIDAGMVEVWAKDLNKSSFSPCGYTPLRFSFSSDPNEKSRVFTCDHLGKNDVQMWVTDSRGAQSWCMVQLNIQNNNAQIPECKRKEEVQQNKSATLRGTIVSTFGTPVDSAYVELVYHNPKISVTVKVDSVEQVVKDSFINASGYLIYRFKKQWVVREIRDTVFTYEKRNTQTDQHGNFSITDSTHLSKGFGLAFGAPVPSGNPVNSFDVSVLTAHLLNEKVITDPYVMLAADVDENKKVDIQDLVLLISYVGGQVQQLPGSIQHIVRKTNLATHPTYFLEADLKGQFRFDSIQQIKDTLQVVSVIKGDLTTQMPVHEKVAETEDRIIQALSAELWMVPNPAMASFRLNFSASLGKGQLMIYSPEGRVFYSHDAFEAVKEGSAEIDISSWPSGLYLCRWSSGNVVMTKKLLKI